MNSKWKIRLTAACMALMLSASAIGEETPEPSVSIESTGSGDSASAPQDETQDAQTGQDAETSPGTSVQPSPSTTPDATGTANSETTPGTDATPGTSDVPANETDAPQDAGMIASFATLAQSEWALEEKPTLEEALKLFPTVLEAILSDGQTVQVPVAWRCESYETDAETYVFQPTLSDETFSLAEGILPPTVTLRIQASDKLVAGNCTYQINEDNTLTLIAYSGGASAVSVPEQVEGWTVTAVAAAAFAGNDTLETLTLPKTLLVLEDGALKGCARLAQVDLPDSLEKIGSGVFDGCEALKTVRLNISLETTVTDGKGYTRIVAEENGDTRTVQVRLDEPFTDYRVLDGGKWIQDGEIQIDSDHEATVASGGQMQIGASGRITVLGSLSCAGTAVNEGSVIACAGTVSGVDGNVTREHTWSDGVCAVCGARQALPLTITPKQTSFEKTYDGTSGVDIGPDDFTIEGVREGDEVTLAAVNLNFDEKDVGSYLVSAAFELGGANADDYSVMPVEISVVISPREVTVTPRSGQSKTYGSADPTLRAGYRGTVSGETLSGALAREKGEDVGTYKILTGTLEKLNPNYRITLAEETFAVTPKSVSAGSVTMAKVSNQRYTGNAAEPKAELTDGGYTLREGVDYTLSYENNVEMGTATLTVTGKGNYTGSRQATFQIIKVSSGTGGGISSGNFGGADVTADDTMEASDTLVLDGEDWGAILFDESGESRAFTQTSRRIQQEDAVRTVLCLRVEADEETLEYGQPRMELNMTLITALRASGYTDVELQVGEGELRVPLETLYAEYVSESGTLSVDHYELQLWPEDSAAWDGYRTVMTPVHCEVLAMQSEDDTGEDVLSLLDGVQLRLVPEETPDYENVRYDVLRRSSADPDAVHEPEGAAFILDASRVKCSLTPTFGGVYALAVQSEE